MGSSSNDGDTGTKQLNKTLKISLSGIYVISEMVNVAIRFWSTGRDGNTAMS